MNKQILTGMLGMLISLSANAVEVEGVDVPEAATVGDQELVLNGAGVRKKLWIEVYVGALYVVQRTNDAAAVVAADGAKRITMHMLYEVSKKKLVKAWNVGFESNTDAAVLEKQTNQILTFNDYFNDTEVGDLWIIDIVPGTGTTVTINGKIKGTIAGREFGNSVLNIWLGEKPPTDDLKTAMLGG